MIPPQVQIDASAFNPVHDAPGATLAPFLRSSSDAVTSRAPAKICTYGLKNHPRRGVGRPVAFGTSAGASSATLTPCIVAPHLVVVGERRQRLVPARGAEVWQHPLHHEVRDPP